LVITRKQEEMVGISIRIGKHLGGESEKPQLKENELFHKAR